MNKPISKITCAMVTAVLLSFSGTILAQDDVSGPVDSMKKGRHHQRGPQALPAVERMMRAIRHLDLDDEQKASIKLTMQNLRGEDRALKMEMRAGHEQLKALITAEVYDEDAVAEVAEKEGAIAAERLIISSRAMSAVYSQLTDEQRLELETMAAERAAKRGEKRGKRQKPAVEG